LCALFRADRRAVELASPWIQTPRTAATSELRREVEAVVRRRSVGTVVETHLGGRALPLLVLEEAPVHADHLIEAVGVSALAGNQEDRRALVRDDALSVDEKLVPARLAAEDRVVVEHQAAAALVLLEEDGRCQPAEPSADHDEVIHLARIRRAR